MATNKIYMAPGTPITITGSGGDAVITTNNLGFGVGRVSAQFDRGIGAKAKLHEIMACIQWAATAVVGNAAEIYIFESDGTYLDGSVGVIDAALATDKRKNGMFVGAVICDTTSGATNVIARFRDVPLTQRYFSVGIWNASATKNLQATANASLVIVTPNPDDIQAAA